MKLMLYMRLAVLGFITFRKGYYVLQIKGLSLVFARIAEKIQRTGWRDAGRDGPHPKMKPGTGPLAAVPPGGRGTLPRSEVEAVPYGGCYADP